jgi:hypothetical protein
MPRQTQVIYSSMHGEGGTVIDVDEGIFAVLTYEKRDGETCNDVLRRLMGLPALPGD